jgi:hypothetical protein
MNKEADGPLPLREATSRSVWTHALDGLDELGGMGRVPLQQSWDYGAAMAHLGLGVTRLIWERDDKTIAAAQVIERRIWGQFRLVTVMNGPLWAGDATAHDRRAVLTQLRARYRRRSGAFLFIVPDRGDVPDVTRLYRAMGARRIMTGSATIWLDLTRGEDGILAGMSGKWRNALRKGEQAGLDLKVRKAGAGDLDWITGQEHAQAGRVGYRALPPAFIRAFAKLAPNDVFYAEARHDRAVVASALFLRHGPSATYQIGWTNDAGRDLAAQPALIMQAIRTLKGKGVTSLDLGGIDTVNGPGVARFKLGLGGDVVQGPGTYF